MRVAWFKSLKIDPKPHITISVWVFLMEVSSTKKGLQHITTHFSGLGTWWSTSCELSQLEKAYIKQHGKTERHGKCCRENLLFIAGSHPQNSSAQRLCVGTVCSLAACQEQSWRNIHGYTCSRELLWPPALLDLLLSVESYACFCFNHQCYYKLSTAFQTPFCLWVKGFISSLGRICHCLVCDCYRLWGTLTVWVL